MLFPELFRENVWDDWFEPAWNFGGNIEKKLYGRHANRVMCMDVHQYDDHYEADIDLPGFKKEDVEISYRDGYVTIKANKGHDVDRKDKGGTIVCQERYSGTMSRSFYVGEAKPEDITAKFEDGVLRVNFPRTDTPKIEEHKTIAIE